MVFIFVPPHKHGRRTSRRDNATGIFIAVMIALGFAVFVAFMGPESGSPPPAIVKWMLAGIAVIFAFVGFFAWLRSLGQGDDAAQDNNPNEES